MTSKSTAWWDGYMAHGEAIGISRNPYDVMTQWMSHTQWDRGWQHREDGYPANDERSGEDA